MSIEFYVYEYSDPTTNEIFYVGKGKENRCYDHIADAKRDSNKGNLHKKSKIRNILKEGLEPIVTIVYRTTNEQDAYDEEGRRIQLYGRRDLGTGPLTNLNDGGTGSTSPSKEIRNKIGSAMRGKKHSAESKRKITESLTGKIHSEETKQKMSEAAKGKVCSEETKQKMSKAKENYVPWNKGKQTGYVSAGAWQKGNEPWNKGKEHMKGEDNPMFGKNHSEDTKMKMSNAVKGRKRVYRKDGSYYMIKPEVV
ncbi:MAG: hypothetical protein DRH08_04000 [Deltaproteobacteria bacterium]|nr:MAG: hypothetical protein DRH08_04000 [Deltaproteobacteria bacterium]